MTTIGIFLFPGVEELDFVGPWEVLRAWERVWPDDGQHVTFLAREEGVITCAMGMRVLPQLTWATAPPLDVLVHPGGQGTVGQIGDETVRGRVRSVAEAGTLITSVCTGALLFADSGLIDGRPATTPLASLDHLASLGTDNRGAAGRPLRRRRQHHHVGRRVGRHRLGPAPRRPPGHTRPGARGPALHPVRP